MVFVLFCLNHFMWLNEAENKVHSPRKINKNENKMKFLQCTVNTLCDSKVIQTELI